MSRFRSLIVAALLLTLSIPQASAQTLSDPAAWHNVVSALQPGTRVALKLTDGKTFDGFVLAFADDSFTFKPRTRIPVPSSTVSYADVASIEKKRGGMSPGKKVLIGAGAGVGAIFLSLLFVVASLD